MHSKRLPLVGQDRGGKRKSHGEVKQLGQRQGNLVAESDFKSSEPWFSSIFFRQKRQHIQSGPGCMPAD